MSVPQRGTSTWKDLREGRAVQKRGRCRRHQTGSGLRRRRNQEIKALRNRKKKVRKKRTRRSEGKTRKFREGETSTQREAVCYRPDQNLASELPGHDVRGKRLETSKKKKEKVHHGEKEKPTREKNCADRLGQCPRAIEIRGKREGFEESRKIPCGKSFRTEQEVACIQEISLTTP